MLSTRGAPEPEEGSLPGLDRASGTDADAEGATFACAFTEEDAGLFGAIFGEPASWLLGAGFSCAFSCAFTPAFGVEAAPAARSGFLAEAWAAVVPDAPASFVVTFPTLMVPFGSTAGSRDGVRAETTSFASSALLADPDLTSRPVTLTFDRPTFEFDASEPETLRLSRAGEFLAIGREGYRNSDFEANELV